MIRPVYAVAFAMLTFFTGSILGYSAHAAQTYSVTAAQSTSPTATPAADKRAYYYAGVYDTCVFFAVNAAGETEQDAQRGCFGFVEQVSKSGWYEARDK